ncbi:MAG TPA: hypothetical protein VGQ98_08775 [Gemmatimonadaceae bacterium]|nr:hypothetical protein [Gemmatimonadaceae bacterium]
MKHTHGEGVLFVALLAALAACADPASRTVGLSVPNNAESEPTPSSANEERAALSKIARLVALAMDNEPARQHLKRDMRAAPFHEHKLELVLYLRSKDGKALLDRMVKQSGETESDLFKTLSTIRRLEFYMPVAKHRESWTGNDDVLVVSQLAESDPIVAFDESGSEVTLDRNVAPTQPTLSIVPVETRFDQPLPAIGSKNVRDRDGRAIGTLESIRFNSSSIVCGAGCGDYSSDYTPGGSSGAPPAPPALYLEFSRILDMKEPWFRGDPEIEVHIQGPTSLAVPTYGADISCSGEHALDPRKVFDQNGGFWQGRVMLFSGDETVAFMNKFSQGFHILFWEDDNEPCVLKLETNVLAELLKSTATAFSTVAIKVLPGASIPVMAGVFLGTFFANAGAWLLTNDDFLGAAVDQASAGYYYPGNTHVIMDGTTLNGRATIVYR